MSETTLERPTVRVPGSGGPDGVGPGGRGPGAGGARRGRGRAWWLVPFAAVWLLGTAYLLSAYLPPLIRTSRVPMHGDQLHYWLLIGHIYTAGIATVTGFAQFWPWLRRRYPVLHRWTGRVYFFGGVFPSMVLAVPVALYSGFGFSNMTALLAVDALWAVTGIAGYRAVRQHRYADHRRWMVRNFAVLLASLASRIWQVVGMLIVLPQLHLASYQGDKLAATHDVMSASVWIALLVNLLIAELWLQRRYGVPSAASIRRSRGARAGRTVGGARQVG